MNTYRSALVLLVAVSGCNRGGGLPNSTDGGIADLAVAPLSAPPDLAMPGQTMTFSVGRGPKVDLLFMVGNTAAMLPMADELAARFSQLVMFFGDLAAQGIAADIHLGVVTSDYGAGATGAPGCQPSPGGELGHLQPIGLAAPKVCKAPMGANFVQYVFGGANNLPQGQDLAQTFSCMAAGGAEGCGFGHALESVYVALHHQVAQNQGFLRADALLAVVFLSSQDDGSAPPSTMLFDRNSSKEYGFEDSYRKTRFGVMCGTPASLTPYDDSMGAFDGCVPATNPPGEEYDVSRYINFFTRSAALGGVKADPDRVFLVAIDAPSAPFQVVLSNPGTPGAQFYKSCEQLDENSNPPCVPVLQHACVNPLRAFVGDPAVRLNAVVAAAAHHATSSICDSDYTIALQSLGKLVGTEISGGCVPAKLTDPLHPMCVVTDSASNQDGSTTKTVIPQCAAQKVAPCWHIDPMPKCNGLSPQSVQLIVERNGVVPSPSTQTSATCMAM